MIAARDVFKNFDGIQALAGLNMFVPKGAIYGLVGPNGAGKSTIIRHLTGIYKQDSGEITIGGEGVFENPEVKARTAYVPDDIFYFPQESTRDIMKFYKGIYPSFDCDRYERLREAFPLDEKLPIRKLSKGMQKQSAFWLALSLRPDIMILDEPVDGLDPVMRRQVWSLAMADCAENGTTILVSSHNLRELEDVCDHVGIMSRGKLLLERSLSDLQGNVTKLQAAFPDGHELPQHLNVMHSSGTGKLRTYIVRGNAAEVESAVAAAQPLFVDIAPLSLEEIFIYELGGEDYEIREIIL